MGRPEPDYGRRLLVHVVDEYAASDPGRVFAYVPAPAGAKDDYHAVTHGQLANAVNLLAHELTEAAGKRRPEGGEGGDDDDDDDDDNDAVADDGFPTVAYIGPGDVRYMIVLLACIKARHKALFVSPRNSLQIQLALLRAARCRILYFAEPFRPAVEPWLASHAMRAVAAPAADVWLRAEPPPFPHAPLFDEARWHPLVVLHTSGSSGTPKPVVVRQGAMAIADGLRRGPDLHGAPSAWTVLGRAERFFMPMPLFHMAGIAAVISTAIYYGAPLVLPAPDRPLSADVVVDSLARSGADVAVLPPSILEDLSLTDEGIRALAALKLVAFGGGSLAPAVGDLLAERHVRLSNMIASTECAPYTTHHQANLKLWQYFIIDARDMGAEFRPVDWDEGVYEMVLCRGGLREPGRKAVFYNFPTADEWPTGDLFSPHPTLSDHWMYRGRGDNVIVFSNGEKLNPVAIEDLVLGHPDIKGALVVGQQRFEPALILEPAVSPPDAAAAAALIDDVWPRTEAANKATAAHGRIARDMVVLSDPDRPFLRAAKGSIQRGATVKAYKGFIDRLYQHAHEHLGATVALDLGSEEALTQSIVAVAAAHAPSSASVGPDTDIFSVGTDSLQVLGVSRLLRAGLRAAAAAVGPDVAAPRVIYANPTPRLLARHLFAAATGGGGGGDGGDASAEVKTLSNMVARYTQHLPAPNARQAEPADEGQTVLVSGTTGSLGAYMLDMLVRSPRVERIVALNRGADGGRARQPAYNAARGLTVDFAKVDFVGVDLSLLSWGLDEAVYGELLASADCIIHNAWPVNFAMGLASFEPHVRGVRHLVDFANKAARRLRIVFVSSIAVVQGWTAHGPVPEQSLSDLTLPRTGYGRSKLAGSLVLDAAAVRSRVPVVTVRLGQVTGPRGQLGVWNRREMIPSLVAASVRLGVLPDSIGALDTVDWIPIEDAAGLLLDVSGVTGHMPASNALGYFHGVNPRVTSWVRVAEAVQAHYGGRIDGTVPLGEWVARLEESAGDADAASSSAVQLLDTYRDLASARRAGTEHVWLETSRTLARSATMRALEAISPELVRAWCEQWRF